MFKEYERVRIKRNGVTGVIVDKSVRDGKVYYVIESDKEGPIDGGYGDLWPLFDCEEGELQSLSVNEAQPIDRAYRQPVPA